MKYKANLFKWKRIENLSSKQMIKNLVIKINKQETGKKSDNKIKNDNDDELAIRIDVKIIYLQKRKINAFNGSRKAA